MNMSEERLEQIFNNLVDADCICEMSAVLTTLQCFSELSTGLLRSWRLEIRPCGLLAAGASRLVSAVEINWP
jgi:hypothetical protein